MRWIEKHRSRGSVNIGGKTFLPENIIYVSKINEMPEFYMIFARKNIFPNFGENQLPCPPPSPTSMDTEM